VLGQEDKGTTTIITFDGVSGDDYPTTINVIRNVIKVDWWNMLLGDYSVYYERTLNSKLAGEVGLGLTGYRIIPMSFSKYDPAEDLGQFSPTESYDNGFTGKLGLKFYPGALAPEGFFIQAQLAMIQRLMTYKFDYYGSSLLTNEMQVQEVSNEMRVLLGYSTFDPYFWFDTDDFIFEYALGASFRSRSYDKLYSKEIPSQGSGTDYEIYKKSENDFKIGFYLAIKIGYAF
jgi:hypothetical protein